VIQDSAGKRPLRGVRNYYFGASDLSGPCASVNKVYRVAGHPELMSSMLRKPFGEKKNEHTGRSSHKRQRFSPKRALCLRQPKVENLLFFLVDALLPSVGQAGHKKSWQIFFCPSGLWLVIIFLSFGFRLEEIKGQRYKPFSLKGWARRPSISKTFFY